jgi:hypothetical protein
MGGRGFHKAGFSRISCANCARFERNQYFADRARSSLGRSLLMKFVDHHLAIDAVEVDQEFVGMFRRDFEWVERFSGEVLQVVSHDHLATCCHGRSEEMTVLLLVCHRRNQLPIALLNPGVRKMIAQLIEEVVCLFPCSAQLVSKRTDCFFNDFVGPACQKEPPARRASIGCHERRLGPERTHPPSWGNRKSFISRLR